MEGKGGNLVCGNINSISHIFHIGATDLILICHCSLVDFAFNVSNFGTCIAIDVLIFVLHSSIVNNYASAIRMTLHRQPQY